MWVGSLLRRADQGGMDFRMDSPFILGRSSIIYNPLTFPPCLHQAIPTWRHGFSTRLVLVLRDGIPIVPTRLVGVLILRNGIPIIPTRLVGVLVLRNGIHIVPTRLVSVLVLRDGILIIPQAWPVF